MDDDGVEPPGPEALPSYLQTIVQTYAEKTGQGNYKDRAFCLNVTSQALEELRKQCFQDLLNTQCH